MLKIQIHKASEFYTARLRLFKPRSFNSKADVFHLIIFIHNQTVFLFHFFYALMLFYKCKHERSNYMNFLSKELFARLMKI